MNIQEKIRLLRKELGLSLVDAKKAIIICCYDQTLDQHQKDLAQQIKDNTPLETNGSSG
ncbi:MAG: hypothetical protein ACXADB_13085 [Candidatus Hermodarchaeia archaeon]|jgi:UDP-N-acetylglucosamine transferase subunit ALG13